MGDGIQPWLYSVISDLSLGSEDNTVITPKKAVIMYASYNMDYLLLHDNRYSIFAMVDINISQILQRYSKFNRKELVGSVITLTDFHFACINNSINEQKKIIIMHIHKISEIIDKYTVECSYKIKSINALESIGKLGKILDISVFGFHAITTCRCLVTNISKEYEKAYNDEMEMNGMSSSQNSGIGLSQIPHTQDSITLSTPSKESDHFSGISEDITEDPSHPNDLQSQVPVELSTVFPLAQSIPSPSTFTKESTEQTDPVELKPYENELNSILGVEEDEEDEDEDDTINRSMILDQILESDAASDMDSMDMFESIPPSEAGDVASNSISNSSKDVENASFSSRADFVNESTETSQKQETKSQRDPIPEPTKRLKQSEEAIIKAVNNMEEEIVFDDSEMEGSETELSEDSLKEEEKNFSEENTDLLRPEETHEKNEYSLQSKDEINQEIQENESDEWNDRWG